MGLLNSIKAELDQTDSRYWTSFGDGDMVLRGEHPHVKMTPQKALKVSAYFACLRAISEDSAKLPFHIMQTIKARIRKKAIDHPSYRCIHTEPNPNMTAMSFWETFTSHAIAWHGGFAEIRRDGRGNVKQLWPIHPSRVELKWDGEELVYLVHTDDLNGNHAVTLRQRDMLAIHGLGPDGTHGYMLADLAAQSVHSAQEAQNYGTAYFSNDTTPGGILEFPKKLSDAAVERLRATWNKEHQGSLKAHNMKVLEEGGIFKPITSDPDKAQLVGLRQHEVEDLARWFRVPPHIIQHLLRATFSNIEHQSIEYAQHALMPWAIRTEQELDRKLFVPGEPFYTKRNLDALMRGDMVRRSQYYRTMFNIGSMSQNDIRDLEDMNEIENGDVYYVAGNLLPSQAAANLTGEGKGSQPKPPGADMENVVSAHRPVLEDALQRVLAKSENAYRKEAERGTDLGEWAESWFAKEADLYKSTVEVIINAMNALTGYDLDVQAIAKSAAESWVEDCRKRAAANQPLSTAKDEAERVLNHEI